MRRHCLPRCRYPRLCLQCHYHHHHHHDHRTAGRWMLAGAAERAGLQMVKSAGRGSAPCAPQPKACCSAVAPPWLAPESHSRHRTCASTLHWAACPAACTPPTPCLPGPGARNACFHMMTRRRRRRKRICLLWLVGVALPRSAVAAAAAAPDVEEVLLWTVSSGLHAPLRPAAHCCARC